MYLKFGLNKVVHCTHRTWTLNYWIKLNLKFKTQIGWTVNQVSREVGNMRVMTNECSGKSGFSLWYHGLWKVLPTHKEFDVDKHASSWTIRGACLSQNTLTLMKTSSYILQENKNLIFSFTDLFSPICRSVLVCKAVGITFMSYWLNLSLCFHQMLARIWSSLLTL